MQLAVFVGAERREVIDHLRVEFDAAVDTGRPRMVCLLAEAGWGKSRIVQELYARIADDRQDEAAPYWPSRLIGHTPDPMHARKVIHPSPDTVFDRDRVMPWLWWGIRCEIDASGVPVHAVQSHRGQLVLHLLPLVRAAEAKGLRRETVAKAVVGALGFVPGVGTALGLLEATYGTISAVRKHLDRRPEASASEQAHALGDISADLDLVQACVGPELPLVLIVDDLHDADPATLHLLRGLMRAKLPVLVVACGWPSVLDEQVAAEADLPADERRLPGSLVDELAANDHVSIRRLAPLDRDALAAIVHDVAPATTNDRVAVLSEVAAPNPLVLQLQLDSDIVRRHLRDGAIEASAEDLRKLPDEFAGLVAARLSRLPPSARAWLDEGASHGTTFVPELLATRLSDDDRALVEPYVRFDEDDEITIARFVEDPVQLAVARNPSPRTTTREQKRLLREAVTRVHAWWGDDTTRIPSSPLARLVLARQSVRTLTAMPPSPLHDRDALLVSAATHWSFAARDLGAHEEELQAAVLAREVAEERDVDTLIRARTREAAALLVNNRPHHAVDAVEHALDLAGDSELLTFDLRYVAAWAFEKAGDPAAAAAHAAALVGHGDADDDIGAHHRLARLAQQQGDAEAAEAHLRRMIDAAEVAGDVEWVVIARSDLLDVLDAPIDAHRELLRDAIEALGATNPVTLDLATWVALRFLMQHDLDGFERVLPELPEPWLASDDGEHIVELVEAMRTGDLHAGRRLVREMQGDVNLGVDDQEQRAALESATGGVEAPVGPIGHALQLAERGDLDVAADVMIEFLPTYVPVTDYWIGIAAAVRLATMRLLQQGTWTQREVELRRRAHEAAGQQVPAGVEHNLRVLDAAHAICNGHEPPPPAPTPLVTMQLHDFVVRAVAHRHVGDVAEAETSLRRATALVDGPLAGDPDAHNLLVMAMRRMDHPSLAEREDALVALGTGDRTGDDDGVLRKKLSMLFRLADAERWPQLRGQAKPLWEQTRDDPDVPVVIRRQVGRLLSRAHRALAEHEDSITVAADVVALEAPGDDSWRDRLHLGRALYAAERPDRAAVVEREAWEEIRDDPDSSRDLRRWAVGNLVASLDAIDEFDQARPLKDVLLDLTDDIDDFGRRCTHFTVSALRRRNADEALHFAQRAWAQRRSYSDPQLVVAVGINLLACRRLRDADADRAAMLAEADELVALALTDDGRVGASTARAQVLAHVGRHDDALEQARAGWKLAQRLPTCPARAVEAARLLGRHLRLAGPTAADERIIVHEELTTWQEVGEAWAEDVRHLAVLYARAGRGDDALRLVAGARERAAAADQDPHKLLAAAVSVADKIEVRGIPGSGPVSGVIPKLDNAPYISAPTMSSAPWL